MAPDLDDSALVRDVSDVPRTRLDGGICETLEIFRQLHREHRLETKDLDTQV